MISFECDYNNGCHEKILENLMRNNREYQPGYGADRFTKQAKEKIKNVFQCPEGEIMFLSGGTQTNLTVISSLLKTYEGVIACETGHVAQHEAGAIEYTGHKVLTLPEKEGKMSAENLEGYLEKFHAGSSKTHMVYPGMVYLSYPTEYGTLYSKQELNEIYTVCRNYRIPLYIDGARLGYGLMSEECDMTPAEFAKLCDVFTIGGTKVGALCGEAIVFQNATQPEQFFTMVKQRGAILAKGRLCGIEYDTLFTDELYFTISRYADKQAEKMKTILLEKGLKPYLFTPTNQQFVIMDNRYLNEIQEKIRVDRWEAMDEDKSIVRLCTSWSTTDDDLQQLKKQLPCNP